MEANTDRHGGYNRNSIKLLSAVALLVSILAMIGTAFQAYFAWLTMDRSIEASVLQMRLSECGRIVGKAQVFSNRDAEWRVAVAARDGRVPQNLKLRDIPKVPTQEVLDALVAKRISSGGEFLETASSSAFVFARKEFEMIQEMWKRAFDLLDIGDGKNVEDKSNIFVLQMRNFTDACSLMAIRFDIK